MAASMPQKDRDLGTGYGTMQQRLMQNIYRDAMVWKIKKGFHKKHL